MKRKQSSGKVITILDVMQSPRMGKRELVHVLLVHCKLRSHRMRQRHVFCIWMSKKFITLFLRERSRQTFCIWQLGHLCYCAIGVKAHKKKILRFKMFCASKYKIHLTKTKHSVKPPDIIFLLCILSLPNRVL